jgi:hypothetical protein
VSLQRFFQAVAAIGDGDQVAHLRDAQGPRLASTCAARASNSKSTR